MSENDLATQREKLYLSLRKESKIDSSMEKSYALSLFDQGWFWQSERGRDYFKMDFISHEQKEKKNKIETRTIPDKTERPAKVGEIQIIPELKSRVEIQKKVEIPKKELSPIAHPKILFVTDYAHDDENIFSGEQKDLFEKMVVAMGLVGDEYQVMALFRGNKNHDLLQNHKMSDLEMNQLREKIVQIKPQLILSFGAKVTLTLLERQERLSQVHGLFIEKTFNNNKIKFTTRVVPLFHPDFLLINPNMKKVVWIDLKKVINYLGK